MTDDTGNWETESQIERVPTTRLIGSEIAEALGIAPEDANQIDIKVTPLETTATVYLTPTAVAKYGQLILKLKAIDWRRDDG